MAAEPTAAGNAPQGEQAYKAHCAACHGPTRLGGPGGPPLQGPEFSIRWSSAKTLFEYIRRQMPPGAGASLSDATYADMAAFLQSDSNIESAASADTKPPTPSADLSRAVRPAIASAVLSPAARPTFAAEALAPDPIAEAARARHEARLKAARPVTDAMLRKPSPGDWIHWRGGYDAQGFSPLDKIKPANVGRLIPAWTARLAEGPNQITPLVHDGVVYAASGGRVLALDGVSGEELWRYDRPGASQRPRNLAVYGDLLFYAAATNMVALDMHTGKVVWDTPVISPSDGIFMSGGPVVAKGKVIQGVSGCYVPYPGGCFIVALDALTGKEAWRFHTIARPGNPGGDTWNGAPLNERFGASVWTAGSYDPELDLLFFGTGQTYKLATLISDHSVPPGSTDALYTDSTLAIRPDTGQLAWHYQHFQRDLLDQDWAFERTIATLNLGGRATRTVTTGGKAAIFDTLDAATGKYLFSFDTGLQTYVTAIDPKTGRKTLNPALRPEAGVEKRFCPTSVGGRNWPSTAFNPSAGVLFIPLNDACTRFKWAPGGAVDWNGKMQLRPGGDGLVGRLQAIDVATQKTLWVDRERSPHGSAVLATAGGLLFEGTSDRWFRARDQRTGKILWKTHLDASVSSYPVTYSVDGVQYVAVTTGGGNVLDLGLLNLTPEIAPSQPGVTLWVFRLP